MRRLVFEATGNHEISDKIAEELRAWLNEDPTAAS